MNLSKAEVAEVVVADAQDVVYITLLVRGDAESGCVGGATVEGNVEDSC